MTGWWSFAASGMAEKPVRKWVALLGFGNQASILRKLSDFLKGTEGLGVMTV
jgi:hypothetical protein